MNPFYKVNNRYNPSNNSRILIPSQHEKTTTTTTTTTNVNKLSSKIAAIVKKIENHREITNEPSSEPPSSSSSSSSYRDKINKILTNWQQLQQEKQVCHQQQITTEKKPIEYDEFDRIMNEDLENQLKELERQEANQYKLIEQIIETQLEVDEEEEEEEEDHSKQLQRFQELETFVENEQNNIEFKRIKTWKHHEQKYHLEQFKKYLQEQEHQSNKKQLDKINNFFHPKQQNLMNLDIWKQKYEKSNLMASNQLPLNLYSDRNIDSNTIDLDRAEQAVSTLATASNYRQQGYQPKTLRQHNDTRLIYLPIFPTKSFGPNNSLLLANVPVTCLAPHEILRRQHGAYTLDALIMMNSYQYPFTEGFSLSEQDANELTTRLQVDMSIIKFNADRLRGFCSYLLQLHKLFRQKILLKGNVAMKEPTLNSKQMAIALEFYLQIDVDIFYMKTCSFRGATPLSTSEGLFCGKDEPQARYKFVPCGNLFCHCCYPINNWKNNQSRSIVDFESSSMHQFVNGYTTYLNCPATCSTSNIIYAMTCPCGKYDYVDSTAQTLDHAMDYHRQHGNRIIHEKLTGNRVRRGSIYDPSETEKEIASKMRLYQHTARCPIALRLFLHCNPIYWCFIPMLWSEAISENIIYLRQDTNERRDITPSNTTNSEIDIIIAMGGIFNENVARSLDYIPIPPTGYLFSYRQRQQQRSFFQNLLSTSIPELPYSTIDLYKMAIIAVLPDDRSIILRYIIETLFIIHAETKLNMICPIGGDPQQRYGLPYDPDWCANLNHSSIGQH